MLPTNILLETVCVNKVNSLSVCLTGLETIALLVTQALIEGRIMNDRCGHINSECQNHTQLFTDTYW